MMRAWQITEQFGLENLRLVERPIPEPGPGQVRVRISSVALNYRDVLMIRGFYNPRQPLPLIPCSDLVGTVDACGVGVEGWQIGERVSGAFAQGWVSGVPTWEKLRTTLGGPLDGTLAEYVVLEAAGLVRAPPALSDDEVATLPCAGVTAWSALVTQGGLRAGQTVLVQGTGGVSLFALQFAKMHGARVVLTSSSDEKLARGRALGADVTINYRTEPSWSKPARAATGGVGVDHVVEVGGAGTFDQSTRAVRMGGTIHMIGVLGGTEQTLSFNRVLMQNVRIQGVIVGSRETFEAMNAAIEATGMRPIVDRVFGFEEVHAAIEHLAAGRHFGKVVVRVREEG